jgi:hypothetical protein
MFNLSMNALWCVRDPFRLTKSCMHHAAWRSKSRRQQVEANEHMGDFVRGARAILDNIAGSDAVNCAPERCASTVCRSNRAALTQCHEICVKMFGPAQCSDAAERALADARAHVLYDRVSQLWLTHFPDGLDGIQRDRALAHALKLVSWVRPATPPRTKAFDNTARASSFRRAWRWRTC